MTNLPASDTAFEGNQEEKTMSLADAMTADGAASLSSFAGIVVLASLFGRTLTHLHRSKSLDKPEDYENGEFWVRHRKLDSLLTNTMIFLPEHLRVPNGSKDPNVPFLNMHIQASVICLHQAAILKAEKHELEVKLIKTSVDRCYSAAEEIVSIMKLTSHINVSSVRIRHSEVFKSSLIVIADESFLGVLSLCGSTGHYPRLQEAHQRPSD